jgi:hypothetical protein
MPFTTTTTVPNRASAAPTASRRVSRSPRSAGESRRSEVGSTVISSAALLAVERSMPQLPRPNASAKPTTPIRAMRPWSRAAIRAVRSPRQAQVTRITAPITERARPSIAGGTSSSTTRVTP